MPFAENYMRQGTFTAGTLGSSTTIPTTVNVNCGFVPSKVEIINMSAITSMVTGTPVVNPTANNLLFRASWNTPFSSFSIPFTLVEYITPSTTTSSVAPVITNGISIYDGHAASPNEWLLGPKLPGTNTAKATGTFTISSTATLYIGATILMTSNSVNKQLAGMQFTVATIPNTTTFTIANAGWLNTANFTNGAETFNVQLVSVPPLYYPENAQIVSISQANPAVITTSINMNLTIGQQVRVYVPAVYGMTQANFTTAIVSAVSGNQITLGGLISLNSSAFTAFAWPAATSYPFGPALVVPMGSGPTPLAVPNPYNTDPIDDATMNIAYQGFVVGSNILNTASSTVIGITAGDVFEWTAWRADV